MKRKSGMTSSAMALAYALPGPVCLIVPDMSEKESITHECRRKEMPVQVVCASDLVSMSKVMRSHVLVIDDAYRCKEEWLNHAQGELLDCMNSITQSIPEFITSVYLFDYYG